MEITLKVTVQVEPAYDDKEQEPELNLEEVVSSVSD